ncbi:MBL fold metallo-hydrolase [Dactylosporangium matsuzakiense]|uniref:MBL fold metallo-hydrolase n=2 Tax=Dactylosporangium matsuzakiense TaxID=53360 RepID=A0A9W6KNI6_9ACTN|nr:MBL fold metallo-hydrolase [Dactylosporangium matsuzakiense]
MLYIRRMQLTKYAHACVALHKDGRTIVLDPGTFTPEARTAVTQADAVLITHEHFDHLDEDLLREHPGVPVFGPAAVRAKLGERVTVLAPGDEREIAGFTVTAHGGRHAPIHGDIPIVDNVGLLIDGTVYHPGDSYHAPDRPVGMLLLPTSGPWTKLGEAADFVRAVKPERVLQIHELMLSELGQASTAAILGEQGLTGRAVERLAPGATIEV